MHRSPTEASTFASAFLQSAEPVRQDRLVLVTPGRFQRPGCKMPEKQRKPTAEADHHLNNHDEPFLPVCGSNSVEFTMKIRWRVVSWNLYTFIHIFLYMERQRERSLMSSKVVFSCCVSQLAGRGAVSIGSRLKTWTLAFLFWWNKFVSLRLHREKTWWWCWDDDGAETPAAENQSIISWW